MEATFTRILVPTDFSATSDAALEYARTVAERFGATLHLLHVVEDPFAHRGFSGEMYIEEPFADLRTTLMQEAEGQLASRLLPDDRSRFRATAEAVVGHGLRTITAYAAERGIDLIVMGTHGRTGLAHALMGSVAERVVRTAPCPVLTVRRGVVSTTQPVLDAVNVAVRA
jgi:nucleotide-binding universal stress UspA family protein